MSDLLNSLFGKKPSPKPSSPTVPPQPPAKPSATYQKGNVIGGKYEIRGELGKGGFGVVYLVYSRETKRVYALKTFRSEFLQDIDARNRFHKEALVWLQLRGSPYLVRAEFIEQISGRLHVGMEYIAQNQDGLNSLEGYLRAKRTSFVQNLRWAIQCCFGMEYAYAHGIRCHRDLKPANILITSDGISKISDFGLVGVGKESNTSPQIAINYWNGAVGYSMQTLDGVGFGTPTHMPPEQFTDAAGCDERSDIYSFGVVLFQMATHGRPPFLVTVPRDNNPDAMMSFWRSMRELHCTAPIPDVVSPFSAIFRRCMAKSRQNRYQTFQELRSDLESILKRETGEVITSSSSDALWDWELVNRGASLEALGRYEEAIEAYDTALALSLLKNKNAWVNKGNSLAELGRLEEALACYDRALELDPKNATAWLNKGATHGDLANHEEAIRCYDKVLQLDPNDALAWNNKGARLADLGHYKDALVCYEQAQAIDPRNHMSWCNKGNSLVGLGRYREALDCYNTSLRINPLDVVSWYGKATVEMSLSELDSARISFRKVIELGTPEWSTEITEAQRCLRELERR